MLAPEESTQYRSRRASPLPLTVSWPNLCGRVRQKLKAAGAVYKMGNMSDIATPPYYNIGYTVLARPRQSKTYSCFDDFGDPQNTYGSWLIGYHGNTLRHKEYKDMKSTLCIPHTEDDKKEYIMQTGQKITLGFTPCGKKPYMKFSGVFTDPI